jgi:hypothetical protein
MSEGSPLSDQDRPENEERPPVQPARPAAPPTQAGPLPTPSPVPVWPTVIGVIAIVFGAGGALAGLGGVVMSLVTRPMLQRMPNAPAMPQYGEHWIAWTVLGSLVTCGTAILLLIAGIGIAKRLAWGPRAARVWAVLKMIVVVMGTVISWQTQQGAIEAMKQNAAGAPMLNPQILLSLGMCGGLLWGCALPVFMLIWFTRRSVKEEISRWT